MPPTTIDFLDMARVRSGSVLDRRVRVDGAPRRTSTRYFAQLINNAGVVVVGVATNDTYAQVPPLPAGYDTSVAFPLSGRAW